MANKGKKLQEAAKLVDSSTHYTQLKKRLSLRKKQAQLTSMQL